jgi:hypothetical protein
MKEIYRFELLKEVEKEEPQIQKNDKGEDIKVLVKVKSYSPLTYFIARPSFSLKQESNLYYESVVAECIKRGILSTIQLRKRFVDDGGLLGSEEKKTYDSLFMNLWERKAELNKLNEEPDKNQDAIKELNKTILSILNNLQSIEERSGNSLIYEHTAEKIAGDRTTIWWMLNLAYQDLDNNKFKPVFGDGKFEDKFRVYEQMDEKADLFELELVQKLLLVTSLWCYGGAKTPEDFKAAIEEFESKNPKSV